MDKRSFTLSFLIAIVVNFFIFLLQETNNRDWPWYFILAPLIIWGIIVIFLTIKALINLKNQNYY